MTELKSARPNRRRRIRHKVLTPAYASFVDGANRSVLELNEIVDISEDGVAIQCATPLELSRRYDLCLDLAESTAPIYTTAHVIWSGESGKSGLRFAELTPASLLPLREWLFLNAMAGVADAQAMSHDQPEIGNETVAPVLPSYSDRLAALSAVQREVESLGADLTAVLHLIAQRALALLQGSGAAIALTSDEPEVMVCRSSAGVDAPPVGAKLQVGSGFSGECVRAGKLLRCDDTETDPRVDRESSRALAIRSIVAAPLHHGGKVIGILEVLARVPAAFNSDSSSVMERLADLAASAVGCTLRESEAIVENQVPVTSSPGSVLFPSEKITRTEEVKYAEEEGVGSGVRLPRSQLIILVCAAAAISLALGFVAGPLIQEKIQAGRGRTQTQTVLAASRPTVPAPQNATSERENINQLTEEAKAGDAAAQYSLGMRYNLGEGVTQNYAEAAKWFSLAADQGHVRAQGALGDYYNYGRGVPMDIGKAYFWSYLAFAGGDEVSKLRLGRLANQMQHSEVLTIQQKAEVWYHGHQKTTASR